MGRYNFLANFDIDEMIFPGPDYAHLTIPQLLEMLDEWRIPFFSGLHVGLAQQLFQFDDRFCP